MAARTNRPNHDEKTRQKIQVSQLINRLQKHVLGEVEMTPSQVRSAEILLKKTLPDLQSTKITGIESQNVPENMRASCYLCNDIKNDTRLEELGWKINPLPNKTNDWLGLTEYSEKLQNVGYSTRIKKGDLSLHQAPKKSVSTVTEQIVKIGSLIRTCLPGKKKRRKYKVIMLNNGKISLCEMWQNTISQEWQTSKNKQTFFELELTRTEVISEVSPK